MNSLEDMVLAQTIHHLLDMIQGSQSRVNANKPEVLRIIRQLAGIYGVPNRYGTPFGLRVRRLTGHDFRHVMGRIADAYNMGYGALFGRGKRRK